MSKITSYIKDSYLELTHKVSWPNWSSLQSSAILVMIASFILAVVIMLIDMSFKNIMSWIYNVLY